jgi:hypothetical protein
MMVSRRALGSIVLKTALIWRAAGPLVVDEALDGKVVLVSRNRRKYPFYGEPPGTPLRIYTRSSV